MQLGLLRLNRSLAERQVRVPQKKIFWVSEVENRVTEVEQLRCEVNDLKVCPNTACKVHGSYARHSRDTNLPRA
ncbi:hypothetical protein JYU34_010380 [Plutella xylostella]|uniref:Uncharacterized protein n=1 Tax=Plutella xylostella TaxID=51655 RepID=A0ABQ7QI99_PLUXY|nr:hypothetical protein JYU34_010380 [Plutella xylostella]